MIHYLQRLQDSIVENWDKKALCNYGAESFTFGETAVRIKKLHILFNTLGVKKGDRMAICARNQAGWAVSFLAINTYGAVAVPILADFTPEGIASLATHSESVLLFTDAEIWKKLDVSQIPGVKQVVSISDFSLLYGSESDKSLFDSLDAVFAKAYPGGLTPDDLDFPTDNDKDLAIINYTSGSTGEPKGVMLRYECISANTAFGQKRIPCYPQDNMLSILPLAHMFGMAFELIYPLCAGVTIYFLGRTPSPTILLKAMKEVRPFLVIAVPMVFEKIYRSKIRPMLDKPLVRFLTAIPLVRGIVYSKMKKSLDDAFGGKVRMYIMGGAAVNPEVEEFLSRIKFGFTVGYGMTEAAPLLAYEDSSSFVGHSCGKAIDCVSLRIDSEDPANVVGEIQAKGTNIFSGYYKNEKATKASFTEDGWFKTGDLGLIDKGGNIFIKGRSKSMLLSSNGQNIYPEEIECQINSLPEVNESLVVSREGKLVALVYLDEKLSALKDKANISEMLQGMLHTINAKLPKYSHLASIELQVEPFVKTPKMSIKRYLYS